jgi:hypothetical protein
VGHLLTLASGSFWNLKFVLLRQHLDANCH